MRPTLLKLVLVAHGVFGIIAALVVLHVLRWTHANWRQRGVAHAAVTRLAGYAASFAALCLVTGLLIYPAYRIDVRASFFDNADALIATLPASAADSPTAIEQRLEEGRVAAAAFDVKEHAGVLFAALCVLTWWVARAGRAQPTPWGQPTALRLRRWWLWTGVLGVGCVLIGLFLVTMRSL